MAAAVAVARGADDPAPPPGTTTETYTVPAPDPAPVPSPAPKPKVKAKPRPYQPRPSTPAPAPAPVVRSQPAAQPVVTKPAAPRKRVVHRKTHRKPKVEKKARPTVPHLVAGKAAQSGVLGAQSTIIDAGTDAFDLEAILLVAALSLAAACFGVAAVPATFVPSPPAARLVVLGRVPVLFVGLAVLAAAVVLAMSAW